MADQVSTLARVDTFRAEVAAIGGGPPPVPAPTITNATATPSSLSSPGNVVVDASVTNAMWVSVDGVQQALPATVAVATSRSIPMIAHGQTAPDASVSLPVTVATAPPPGDLSWFTSKVSVSVTNIGTATLGPPLDVSNGRILAASGSVYVPWLGQAGRIVHRGGGHSDYTGNDVLAFDLFTQSPSRLKSAYSPLFVGPNGYHSEVASGLLWANAAGTATVPGQPSSGHTYGQVVALPTGFGTADPLGAMLLTGIPSLTPGGQQHGMSCHAFELTTNQYVPFAGPMPARQPEYSHSFIDVNRRRVVIHAVSASNQGLLLGLNVDTKAYSVVTSVMPSSVNYMVWGHDLVNDLYIGVRPIVGYPPALYVVDPNTGVFTTPGLSSAWPWPVQQSYGGGFWSDLRRAFVYYHGQGEQSFRIVTPPTSGNVRSTPWQVHVENYSGDPSPPDTMVGAGAHCKRLMEMPAAGGALWLGKTTAPIQWFKY